MRITTDHAASSYGQPVILDGSNSVMDYGPGVKAARKALGLRVAELAEACGVSPRTVEGWEQGRRMPPTQALNVMEGLLKTRQAAKP